MKKFRYILPCFLLGLTLSSCNGFLDKEPWDSIDTSKSFQAAEDAIAAVNGAYQPLQWPKLYNMRMWTLDIVAGNSIVGAGGGTDGIETTDMANFITTTDNAGVLDVWRGPSPGILRCNFVIKNVPGMNIDQSLKNRCLGEAKFLRAHYYFILVRLFGGVPLLTEPQTSEDDLKPFRASKEEIYKLIEDDLKEAINLLPDKSSYSASDLGRASKGAAMGLLAKVYLTQRKEYAEIVRLCEEIQKLGYRLNDDYSDNFNPNKKNGPESLFEVQYYGKTNYDFWSNENQSSWLSAFTGPRNSDGTSRLPSLSASTKKGIIVKIRLFFIWDVLTLTESNISLLILQRDTICVSFWSRNPSLWITIPVRPTLWYSVMRMCY